MPCIRDDGSLVPLARDVLAALDQVKDAQALFHELKQPLFMIRKAARELCEAGFVQADGSGYINRRTLLFVGTLDYEPNVAGLKWFLDGIFPKVKERYHDVRLLVVGRRPPEDLVRTCRQHPGVELYPDVPDVGPYYEKCGAVVVPLLAGGGTRIKILEAAITGRPVLSTPLGAHGLGCVNGVHLMLFTDEGSFLERFKRLDEEGTYRDCVEKMHAVVEERYSPAAFDRAMEDVVQGILREMKGRVQSDSSR